MKYKVTFEVEADGEGVDQAVDHAWEHIRQRYRVTVNARLMEESKPLPRRIGPDPAIEAELERFKKEGGTL